MHSSYHIQITNETLAPVFSQQALEAMIKANLGQDRLAGQIGHPEFHFDWKFWPFFRRWPRSSSACSPAIPMPG